MERPAAEAPGALPSIAKAAALLGDRPRVALAEGLARAVAWYRTALGA